LKGKANIIQLVEFGEGTVTKTHREGYEALYIVMEYASGGELFNFIASTGSFGEPLARYFFRQLIEALDLVH
jgi:serine/threonine protein kinase